MTDRLAVKDGVLEALHDAKLTGPAYETLEDRFAMAALKGILAHGHSWHDNESLSAEIYKIARACMAERSKK